MKENIIDLAFDYLDDIFIGNADGHDKNHSIRVYRNAISIASNYPECDKVIISLASLLHDVDDYKLFDTKDNYNARCFLENNDASKDEIERICHIINEVSFSKNRGKKPDSIEGMIVQDADRLDALGAIGIARTFAYGGKNGRTIETSIRHFYDKLLLLKDEMNTKEAKEIANNRHKYLEEYLKEFDKEINSIK